MNPLTALPTKIRKRVYFFYATLGIAFGATQVGYATAHADQPQWLLVAFGVFAYLGTALGLVAAANTAPVSEAQIDAIQKAIARRDSLADDLGKRVARQRFAVKKPQDE